MLFAHCQGVSRRMTYSGLHRLTYWHLRTQLLPEGNSPDVLPTLTQRRSFTWVGDAVRTMIALSRRVGATTLLVITGYGQEALADPDVCPDFVVYSLMEAAEVIAHLLPMDRASGTAPSPIPRTQ